MQLYDFKDLIAFGMLIINLLTFILGLLTYTYLIRHK